MNTTTLPVIAHVAPAELHIESNIREALQLSPEFVTSIRTHGVLQPVLATRTPDGTLAVRDGQRRVLAAIEAQLTFVPAYVIEHDDTTTARIVQQLVTNDQRAAITETERIGAFQQLALGGLTIEEISAQTGHDSDRVERSVRVARSRVASAAVADSSVSLDNALLLAEFEDDEDALAILTRAIERGWSTDHEAQRLRDNRRRQAMIDTKLLELAAEGVPTANGLDYVPLHQLTDGQPADGEKVDPEGHQSCAGHATCVDVNYNDELRLYAVCTTPDAHQRRDLGLPGQRQPGPMTDAEKAERRTVIENNKASDSAATVRMKFVTELLTRKNLPKTAPMFVTQTLAVHYDTISHQSAELSSKMLNITVPLGYRKVSETLAAVLADTPNRAPYVLLASALAAGENSLTRDSWRRPTDGIGRDYLNQLATWGYELSHVEQIITGTTSPN